ncbi:hypothetical protein Geob_0717 [Geotalea daltonii FRC-32]|uniref:Uncharacterized protein n=1 Tax=Geotalea daltonii (strain DSM 22248 / JCM 15807 / FRC-32) TaxID=316067 RepID=B9M111_GEODF|nr:hypothetical protein Geob_0717 [Geotalea daltonii FRC-32]
MGFPELNLSPLFALMAEYYLIQYEGNYMILQHNPSHRTIYADFIKLNGPFAYFITLTFQRLQTIETCTQQINYLIYLLNNKICGRNNNAEFLQGFCFFEKHKTSANNPLHSHIIIKDDSKLDLESKASFADHFWTMINKVRAVKSNCVTDKKAFNPKCCDIRRAHDQDGLIKYVTKIFEKPIDYNYFRPIGKNGI